MNTLHSCNLLINRTNGLAVGNASARVAGIVAPFINHLKKLASWLPNLIFGSTATLVGIVIFRLPDTTGKEMLETIGEAEYFYKTGKPKYVFKR